VLTFFSIDRGDDGYHFAIVAAQDFAAISSLEVPGEFRISTEFGADDASAD